MLFSQRDPRWAAQRLGTVDGATIGTVGCYVTSQAESASNYGHNINPGQLDDIFTANESDPYNKGGYVGGDMCWDGMLAKVFSNFHYDGTYHCESVPCDLSKLAPYEAYGKEAIIELDFDHNPSDGVQTHFVRMYSFNNGDPIVDDPWYGDRQPLSKRYGTDPAHTIQKVVFYSVDLPQPQLVNVAELPVAPATTVSVDPAQTPAPVPTAPVVETPVVAETPVPEPAKTETTTNDRTTALGITNPKFIPFETDAEVIARNGSTVDDTATGQPVSQVPHNKVLTVVGYVQEGEVVYLQTLNLATKMPTHGLPATDWEIYSPKGKLDGITSPTPQASEPSAITDFEQALEQTSSKFVRGLLKAIHVIK